MHKLSIVLKELRETRIWIRLIIKAALIPDDRIQPLLDECQQLANIIGKSIVTAKSNNRQCKMINAKCKMLTLVQFAFINLHLSFCIFLSTEETPCNFVR